MDAVIGREEQRAVDLREGRAKVAGETRSAAGVNVLDHHRVSRGAAAFPQFNAMHPVVGHEIQHPVDVREVGRPGGGGAGVDVLHQHGAGGRAVALPEPVVIRAVVAGEEQLAVDVRKLTGIDPRDPNRAGGCPVALPQVATGAEVDHRADHHRVRRIRRVARGIDVQHVRRSGRQGAVLQSRQPQESPPVRSFSGNGPPWPRLKDRLPPWTP